MDKIFDNNKTYDEVRSAMFDRAVFSYMPDEFNNFMCVHVHTHKIKTGRYITIGLNKNEFCPICGTDSEGYYANDIENYPKKDIKIIIDFFNNFVKHLKKVY